MRALCRLGIHTIDCRGRADHFPNRNGYNGEWRRFRYVSFQ